MSITSLGLAIMFVLLIISFYNVLISNEGQGPERYVDVPGVVVKTLSISGVPSIILAGISFGLSKNYGSRLVGLVLTLSGMVLIIGMMIALSISSRITSEFFHPLIVLVPYTFIAGGVAIFIIGFIFYLKSKKKNNKTRRFN